MATVPQLLEPDAFEPLVGGAFPALVRNGSTIPIDALEFTPASNQAAFWKVDSEMYGSGNLTVKIRWYAGTATSGNVDFGVALACYTPVTDTGDIESKALATEDTVTDTHLGTTAHRVMEAVVSLTDIDSLAKGDIVFLRLRVLSSSTISGVVRVERVEVFYSDV